MIHNNQGDNQYPSNTHFHIGKFRLTDSTERGKISS